MDDAPFQSSDLKEDARGCRLFEPSSAMTPSRCGAAVDNRPGSATQGWHRDGSFLFGDSVELPPHCLTLFLPLVDLFDDTLGPPQFYPGSHMCKRSHLYIDINDESNTCHLPHCTPSLARETSSHSTTVSSTAVKPTSTAFNHAR